MLKTIGFIFLCCVLYHFRGIVSSDKFGNHQRGYRNEDIATAEIVQQNKMLPVTESNCFKVVIKVSGLFNGEDSVSVK